MFVIDIEIKHNKIQVCFLIIVTGHVCSLHVSHLIHIQAHSASYKELMIDFAKTNKKSHNHFLFFITGN